MRFTLIEDFDSEKIEVGKEYDELTKRNVHLYPKPPRGRCCCCNSDAVHFQIRATGENLETYRWGYCERHWFEHTQICGDYTVNWSRLKAAIVDAAAIGACVGFWVIFFAAM